MALMAIALAVTVGLAPAPAEPDLEVAGPTQPEAAHSIIVAQLPDLTRGDKGAVVQQLQDSLFEAGFRPGQRDGTFGWSTWQAVMAFQKHHGLERDGVFRSDFWPMLAAPIEVTWRQAADRVEVDIGKQVLYLVRDNEVVNVIPVSSGNGRSYLNFYGNVNKATTPEGQFEFYKQRNYLHESYLGFMYKPYYFRGGYAIHGSSSVPSYPASHGCIRVTNSDMDYLRQHLELGMPIYVYGKNTDSPASDKPLPKPHGAN